MPSFTDSLRGYSSQILKRDHYICQYCGADGTKSFETWLTLTSEHLLPKWHPKRNDPDYIVTACNFCNVADNRYFDKAKAEGFDFDGLSATELIKRRLPFVLKTRQDYKDYWDEHVTTSSK